MIKVQKLIGVLLLYLRNCVNKNNLNALFFFIVPSQTQYFSFQKLSNYQVNSKNI